MQLGKVLMRYLKSLYVTIALAAVIAGCLPPAPQQLAPTRLSVSRAPGEVVQIAARELTAAGFEITTSDAAGGILAAKRVRTPEGQGSDLACQYAKGSIAARTYEAHMTISLTANRGGQGTDVQIVSAVVAKRGVSSISPSVQLGDSAEDCASTGALERRVADAVR